MIIIWFLFKVGFFQQIYLTLKRTQYPTKQLSGFFDTLRLQNYHPTNLISPVFDAGRIMYIYMA